MKQVAKFGPLYFILTYALLVAWLYLGVAAPQFEFCLSGRSPVNFLGLLSGVFGALTLWSYNRHEVGEVRLFGWIAFVFGLLPLLVVVVRFVRAAAGCVI